MSLDTGPVPRYTCLALALLLSAFAAETPAHAQSGRATGPQCLDGVRRNLEEAVRLTNGIAY